jgi:hypothetical protein
VSRIHSLEMVVCFLILTCFPSVCVGSSEATHEKLKHKYVPQSTPEATYSLELELLYQGMYCYDLPLYDPKWREKSKDIILSLRYKETAKERDIPLKVRKEGRYAIIYSSLNLNKSGGPICSYPIFLYKDPSGWVLDRTAVEKYIYYSRSNTDWFAYEGDYPYLKLLKAIFSLRKVKLDNGVWAWRME